eukprot:TRINITY_DN41_c1_g1_i2.p1 TRINITY_DN41_c1_g1~~TRINITY_DN41_c1_g1_i2.p1  ORF type:complete len:216 (+),score=70.33 TRINITY_DN41_c1_g1_i2:879-1526(+)
MMRDKAVISWFMDEIGKDSGRYCIGPAHTLLALQEGAAQIVIVDEQLTLHRYVMRDASGVPRVLCMTEAEMARKMRGAHRAHSETDRKGKGKEKEDGVSDLEEVEHAPLVDWLAEHCGSMGARLFLVRDCSPEGHQFCKGFGGVGAILRYPAAYDDLDGLDQDEEDSYDEDEEDTREQDHRTSSPSTSSSASSTSGPSFSEITLDYDEEEEGDDA